MNDREFLEMAAKAAGYVVTGLGGMSRGVFVHHEGAQPDECGDLPNFHWDPLTDDGDALRLAVKLQLLVSIEEFQVLASDGLGLYERIESTYAKDPATATRRAIVRAAAEIGRSMQ